MCTINQIIAIELASLPENETITPKKLVKIINEMLGKKSLLSTDLTDYLRGEIKTDHRLANFAHKIDFSDVECGVTVKIKEPMQRKMKHAVKVCQFIS